MYIEAWVFWTAVVIFIIDSLLLSKWVSMIAKKVNELDTKLKN